MPLAEDALGVLSAACLRDGMLRCRPRPRQVSTCCTEWQWTTCRIHRRKCYTDSARRATDNARHATDNARHATDTVQVDASTATQVADVLRRSVLQLRSKKDAEQQRHEQMDARQKAIALQVVCSFAVARCASCDPCRRYSCQAVPLSGTIRTIKRHYPYH